MDVFVFFYSLVECNGLVGLLEMYRVHDLEILEEDGFVMFDDEGE